MAQLCQCLPHYFKSKQMNNHRVLTISVFLILLDQHFNSQMINKLLNACNVRKVGNNEKKVILPGVEEALF